MTTDERTPLLADGDAAAAAGVKKDRRPGSWSRLLRSVFGVENRILFSGFLITLAFSFTQVPLFYAFHLMECDAYYDTHPPYEGTGDRCSKEEIAAGTALQYSILGMSTTLCGTLNLFIAGWTVKKVGPRSALLLQIFLPAIRVVTQILGVVAGKRAGMLIIQYTQLFTILGGPVGYILIINIIAGEVVEPLRRTVVFGKLQGAIMLGQGLGFLTGGMLGDAVDIQAPFDVAFVSFIVAGVMARLTLPYISPESMSDSKKKQAGLLAPLRILVPRRLRFANGAVRKHYGVTILCAGIFLGVLATGYAPILIQMYATLAFDFSQASNGWLMAEFAVMRSLFLIFMFPPIISWGRRWFAKEKESAAPTASSDGGESQEILPSDSERFEAPTAQQVVEEPVEPPKGNEGGDGSEFDLTFLRWSLVVDGALTTVTAFATKGWHIYLAAFLLPLGSGSAPAAKGVVTQMCTESQRADALNAVTLVENVARLATQGSFGFIFASLAKSGKAYATFYVNAAVAVVAMLVLLFSNFPPAGSSVIDDEDDEDFEDAETIS